MNGASELGVEGETPRPEVLRPGFAPEGGPVLAGFTTRRGGVSSGRFAELNFSRRWPEPGPAVAENLALLAAQEGFRPEELYTVRQVHGRAGVCCDDLSPGEAAGREADFLVCRQPGRVLGVVTADCLPVLFWEPEAGCVAAAHAGWRGLAAGVLEAVVEELRSRYGARPERLSVAVGPGIGPCCFEVGPEVAERFETRSLAVRFVSGSLHVDLPLEAVERIRAVGVRREAIQVFAECTCCNPDKYHSYRRDGPQIGQHLAFIGIRSGS